MGVVTVEDGVHENPVGVYVVDLLNRLDGIVDHLDSKLVYDIHGLRGYYVARLAHVFNTDMEHIEQEIDNWVWNRT